jgi:alkylhydroperoxidase family enzyme
VLGRAEYPTDVDPTVLEQMPGTLYYRDGTPMKMYSALAHHAPAFHAVRLFHSTLATDSHFTMREREILILRLAVVVGCPYELDLHSELAATRGWLTPAEIDALRERRLGHLSVDDWSPRERALASVSEQIATTANLTDESWQSLSPELTTSEIVEAILWTGYYRLLAGVANGFAFAPDSAPPLD